MDKREELELRAEVEKLRQQVQQYEAVKKELREKGLIYTTCSGCGWAYSDQPEMVLEAVKGRDCGCPAGSGFAVRTVSRKRTPWEIEAWAAIRLEDTEVRDLVGGPCDRYDGYMEALKDLQAFLNTRHAKKYTCEKCHDEKVLHDTPTPGIETPCPDCT